MADSSPEPHPLDADDASSGQRTKAVDPVLKISVIAVILCFGLAFLSGVAASNAPPNSTMETTSLIVNRFSMLALLVGFCVILVVYRAPQWKQTRVRAESLIWLKSGYLRLVAANLLGLGLLLGGNYLSLSNMGPNLGILFASLYSFYVALLVTMIVWHTGYLRAYAIGALTVLTINLIPVMSFISFGGMSRYSRTSPASWLPGLLLLNPVIAGLLCAGYVKLLLFFRSNRRAPSRIEETT